MDTDELKEEIAHQRTLVKQHRQRLRLLEQQAAKFGPLHVPPHIQIEIDELQEKIRSCEQTLTQLGADLSEHRVPRALVERYGYTKQRVQRVMLLSVIIGGFLVLYTLWSVTRPVSVELIVANFAVGLAAGMLIDGIKEAATQRFKE